LDLRRIGRSKRGAGERLKDRVISEAWDLLWSSAGHAPEASTVRVVPIISFFK
jgi:hypothetical protein